jgi:anti-anti-sigma factor
MDLTVNVKHEETSCIVELSGDLDTNTAQNGQKELLNVVVDGVNLVLDFKDLNYVSSAGLRAILIVQKEITTKKGALKIINMPGNVREVFDMVGFTALFEIE